MTTDEPSPQEDDGGLTGLSISVGYLISAAIVAALPPTLDLASPWPTASRISAWALVTIGLAATGIELETLGRKGFKDLGIGLLVVSVAAGLIALATRVLSGTLAPVIGVGGVLIGLLGVAGAVNGVGRLVAAAGGPPTAGEPPTAERLQRPWSPVEKWGVVLAFAQLVVGVIAIFAA